MTAVKMTRNAIEIGKKETFHSSKNFSGRFVTKFLPPVW